MTESKIQSPDHKKMAAEIKRSLASDIWAMTGDSSIVSFETFPSNDERKFAEQAVLGVQLVWKTVHESVFVKVENSQTEAKVCIREHSQHLLCRRSNAWSCQGYGSPVSFRRASIITPRQP